MVQILPQEPQNLLGSFLQSAGQGFATGFEEMRKERQQQQSLANLAKGLKITDENQLNMLKNLKPQQGEFLLKNIVQREQGRAFSSLIEKELGLAEGSMAGFTPEQATAYANVRKSKPDGGDLPAGLTKAIELQRKRSSDRLADITRPFEKRDAFGSIFLDFGKDEKQKAKALKQIEAERKLAVQEARRLYERYGVTIPKDLETIVIDGELSSLLNQASEPSQMDISAFMDIPRGNGQALTQEIGIEIFKRAGGDKQKATKIAQELGYIVPKL